MRIIFFVGDFLFLLSAFSLLYYFLCSSKSESFRLNILEKKLKNTKDINFEKLLELMAFYEEQTKSIFPKEVHEQMIDIHNLFLSLEAKTKLDHWDTVNVKTMATFKYIILEYFPTLIKNYIVLPKGFAKNHKNNEGKTADELLKENLNLLSVSIADLVNAILEQDVQKIKIQKNFLIAKFGQKDNFFNI